MEKSLNWGEFVITRLIRASGYSAILFVALIFFFLVREGLPTFGEVETSSLTNIRWYPIEDRFGTCPHHGPLIDHCARLLLFHLGLGRQSTF
jgi:ABC-type phosphate transport system permease subunit